MKRPLLLIFAFAILLTVEILRVYFIMPFPGSQRSNTIDIAYFINNNIWWIRLLLIILMISSVLYYLRKGRWWQKTILIFFMLLYGLIAYAFNFKFLADKMFYQPKEKLFATTAADTTDKNKLIIGVALGDEAKAYPIEIIGYHHQVRDTVDHQPVMITYCTVCRTGRVYSPFVDGKMEQFRLVGMDHFNAMFEDQTTKSWWQQATGVAIAGSLKGKQLPEIFSRQMRLGDWLILHPNSTVLQPDKNFKEQYDSLKGYDAGTIHSGLEKRDSASWKFKSWVIGINLNGQSKAYDWNTLTEKKVIHDQIGKTRILLTVEPDNRTFYAFALSDTSNFSFDPATNLLKDDHSKLICKLNGQCTNEAMKEVALVPIQAYQEFWHSWRTFHPSTTKYE
ncbi:MAG: DUF3179 domain-containing protein [Bacteroidetes bacterium]|nr:DUF3179 domain-containing protein [Bacteroidota bacterium]